MTGIYAARCPGLFLLKSQLIRRSGRRRLMLPLGLYARKARASWMPWAVAGLVGLLAVVALLVVAISSSGKKEKEVVRAAANRAKN